MRNGYRQKKKSRKRAAAPERGRPARPRPPREPNELELLFARGIARVLDLGDAALQVVERDPDRAVNAVVSGIEGVGKIADFVKRYPAEARGAVAVLAAQGVNELSKHVIKASARQLRRDLGKKRLPKDGK